MEKPVRLINLVLLFRDASISLELGPALWAATQEVAKFYNLDMARADFRRTYIAEAIPEAILSDAGLLLPAGAVLAGKESPSRIITIDRDLWNRERVESDYVRTYDAAKIIRMAKDVSGQDLADHRPVIITDVLLSPPPDHRYIIWDGDENGLAISTAPIDPHYWRMQDPDRLSIIKHRARTASLAAAGELLGLAECENEKCFLYRNVDSVLRLDDMVLLGYEHDLERLSKLGFEVRSEEPGKIQPIVRNPKPDWKVRSLA